MKTKIKLSIVLILEHGEQFDLVRNGLASQTNKNFELMILSKDNQTTEYPKVANQNVAISLCKTELIYFLYNKDYLHKDFVKKILGYYRFHGSLDLLQFNYLYNNRDTCTTVYKTDFLKKNYLGFDLFQSNLNFSHIKFGLYTNSFPKCKIRRLKKDLVDTNFRNSLIIDKNYYLMYNQMIESMKIDYASKPYLKDAIISEDLNLRNMYESFNM